MSQSSTDITKDDIKLSIIFKTIRRYKYSILASIIFVTSLSIVYAYLSPNIYNAYTKVQISPNKNQGTMGAEDLVSMVMDGGSLNADAEIEIIQSFDLIKKALNNVNMTHHYYTVRRYKKVELYKSSPFEVGMISGYNVTFNLTPINDTQYQLTVRNATGPDKKEWAYSKVHKYGEEVVTNYFHLNVLKKGNMTDGAYSFIVEDIEQAAKRVAKNITVQQKTQKSSILMISYTDTVPLRAKNFTNALAEAYKTRSIEHKTKEAELRLSFINNQLKKITSNLDRSTQKIEEFKRNSNTVDLTENAKATIKKLTSYQEQLSDITMQEKLLNSLSEEIKSTDKIASISVTALSNAYNSQTPLTTMISDLQKAITTKKRLSSDFTSVHPEIRRINNEIKSLKSIISSTINNLNKNMLEKKVLLENAIEKKQNYLNTLPANEREFGELQRKFEVDAKVYSYLLKKQSETAMMKASTISQVSIVDRAFLPLKPIQPKRSLIVVIGLLLGIFLGLLSAFIRANLNNKVQTEEDIRQLTNLPLLGSIPTIKENTEEETLKVFSSPRSVVAESFRLLRSNLQFMATSEKCQIITVTSTVGGEGKSTIAINLAAVMSIIDKKTIVVNIDMRKPTLHLKLGILNVKGLSSYLSRQLPLDESIVETKYENLDIMMSGPIPPNPGELLESKQLDILLEKLKERYDIVILDTPPVGLVADARTLMREADTNLYVVRSNYSQQNFLQNIKKLSTEETSKMGIILNGINIEEDGLGYGYGYYEEDE